MQALPHSLSNRSLLRRVDISKHQRPGIALDSLKPGGRLVWGAIQVIAKGGEMSTPLSLALPSSKILGLNAVSV